MQHITHSLGAVSDSMGAALTVIALLTVVIGWMRWMRPRYRETKQDARAIRDVIVGRPPTFDSVTRQEIQPALPGLGLRLAHQEVQLAEVATAVARVAETTQQLVEVNKTLGDHDGRIKKLEEAAVERIYSRADSTAAWKAIDAALNSTPTPTDTEGE